VKSNKVHECSICGAEFSSGQALGGHIRWYRAFAAATSTTTTTTTTTSTMSLGRVNGLDHESQESKKPRNNLQLDLNLPAPEDDLLEPKFHFASRNKFLSSQLLPWLISITNPIKMEIVVFSFGIISLQIQFGLINFIFTNAIHIC
jgi:hypothetical protein